MASPKLQGSMDAFSSKLTSKNLDDFRGVQTLKINYSAPVSLDISRIWNIRDRLVMFHHRVMDDS